MKSKYTVKLELSVGDMAALCYAIGMAYRVEVGADYESRRCERICRVWGVVRRELTSVLSGGAFAPEWSRCWRMVDGWEERSDEWGSSLYKCGEVIAAARKEVV